MATQIRRYIPEGHEKFDSFFKTAAEIYLARTPLTWLYAKAMAIAESGLRPEAVSPAGARGVMQLMPETGKELGLAKPRDFFDPEKNIRAGTRYLRRMWEFFPSLPASERACFAAAAYNAGAGNILKARARAAALGFPKDDFLGVAASLSSVTFDRAKETLHYVARVKQIHAAFLKHAAPIEQAAP